MVDERSNEAPTSEHELAAMRHISFGRYVAVWVALTVLTILTLILSRINMGPWSIVVALVIATTKAALVVLFFMHLWYARGAMWFSFLIAILWVVVLIGGAVADVTTRFEPARPNSPWTLTSPP